MTATLVVCAAPLAGPAGAGDNNVTVGSVDRGSAKKLSYRSATHLDTSPTSVGYAAAQCPGERLVTGGGGGIEGTGDAFIIDTAPDFLADEVPASPRQAWTTGLYNAAGLAKDVSSHAVCAKPGSLRFAKRSKGPTTDGIALGTKARCPGETQVLGGGIHNEDNIGQILASAPFDGGDADGRRDDGWRARVVPAQDGRTIHVRATCSGSFDLAYRSSETGGTGALSTEAACPDGAAATGGGAEVTGASGGRLNDTGPADDLSDPDVTPDDRWRGAASVSTAAARTLSVHAICKK
jgi:hypothetical protein